MKKAELSVDVLKMFSESAVVPEIRAMFDLKRISFDHQHLSESQMWLTNSFLQLISLHKNIGFKNKEEVIAHLNSIKS
jgi:hypothetical protein